MSTATLFSIMGSLKIAPNVMLKNKSWLTKTVSPKQQLRIKSVLPLYFSTVNSSWAIKPKKSIKFLKNKDGTLVKKKQFTSKILLIDEQGSEKFLYLEEAEKIAKRKKFNLVQEEDKNYKKRKVYRMVSGFASELKKLKPENEPKELASEGLKKKFKKFRVNPGSCIHDVNFKIKHIKELLDKGSNVLLEISISDDKTKLDEIIAKFQEGLCIKQNTHKIAHNKKATTITIFSKNTGEKENTTENKNN